MMRTLSGVSLLLAPFLVTSVLGTASAPAASSLMEYITRAVAAGEPSEIGQHARWDLTCEPLDAPRVTIELPPSHGNVCLSRGVVNLVTSRSGVALSCLGKSIDGVHVVYRATSGFTGNDTVRYGLDVPEGHVSLEVSIAVQPGNVKPSPISTMSASGDTQISGPMPECPDVAS